MKFGSLSACVWMPSFSKSTVKYPRQVQGEAANVLRFPWEHTNLRDRADKKRVYTGRYMIKMMINWKQESFHLVQQHSMKFAISFIQTLS